MDLNTLNDLLECSVCLERLKPNARVLPCQHTFCFDCLKVITKFISDFKNFLQFPFISHKL